jgi:hypothetical protein
MLEVLSLDFTTARALTTGAASALFSKPLIVADVTFTAAASDVVTFAAAHGLETGDGPVRVSNSGGALPGGLVAATDYWVIKLDATTIKFAASLANAIADAPTPVNITDAGTGVHTLADVATTARVLLDDFDHDLQMVLIASAACWVKQGLLPSVAASAAYGSVLVMPGVPLRVNFKLGRYLAGIQETAAAKLTLARRKG